VKNFFGGIFDGVTPGPLLALCGRESAWRWRAAGRDAGRQDWGPQREGSIKSRIAIHDVASGIRLPGISIIKPASWRNTVFLGLFPCPSRAFGGPWRQWAPAHRKLTLERLAKRNLYAITSFIFGMDNDTPGGAVRTLEQIRSWPPGLPVFGLLTPLRPIKT